MRASIRSTAYHPGRVKDIVTIYDTGGRAFLDGKWEKFPLGMKTRGNGGSFAACVKRET